MPIYKTGKQKDGRQQYRVRVNYVDRDGRYRQKERLVYGMAEAKEAEASITRELKDSSSGLARMTVYQLFEEYIRAKKYKVRETTLDSTQRILKRSVLPYFKDVRIDRLNNNNLTKWKNTIDESALSIVSKKNIYSAFRAMLGYAVKMEYIQRNPLSVVGNFTDIYFSNPSDKIQYYTAEQFKQYIRAARSSAGTMTEWGYYVFFNMAFYTGMRKGEINALKWSDIDGDIIKVRRSIAQKLKGEDRETPPKNRSSMRDIQIPSPLSAVLDEHKKRQQSATDMWTEDFRVCGGISCLRDTSLDKANRKFSELAGLPRIRIHDFRHSHVSLLANEGINIQEIARRLGHSKIETTWNTYSHLYPREEERAIKILNKIVENSGE